MGQEDPSEQDRVPTRDEFLDETINEVLEPWKEFMPPWFIEEMGTYLRAMGDAHPVAASLVDRARPRQVPDRSGAQSLENGSKTETRGTGTDDQHR